jgi:orotate phosphoribosyltransferase
MINARSELRDILRSRSVLRGHFTLASGKTSNYYLDCKRTTLESPRGLELIARLMFDRVKAMRPRADAIGGLTIGAAPISIAVSQLAWRELGWELSVFIVRDERKDHGTRQTIAGQIKAGWTVAIVDDVMTTGNSVMKAITAARDHGATVGRVFVLIDREEGGLDTLKGYSVECLYSYKELTDD